MGPRQLFYSTYSLYLHDRAPDSVILTGCWTDYTRSIVFNSQMEPHVCQLYASDGYSLNYYTYLLDKVIASTSSAQFRQKDLLGR